MFYKTSKLLIYAIAILIPLMVGSVAVMAKPAQQTTYLYEFSGEVIDDARGRAVPEMDIQIMCNNTFTSTITCGQDGQWATSFNLSAVTATCDIELLLLPGYQSTRAEAAYSGEVLSPTHIHYTDIPYTPTPGYSSFHNIFYINKPMTVTQTSHFSIEWYTYEHDPDYPNDGNSTNPTKGADYITVIANALEYAWLMYDDRDDYDMPSETPGRSDQLITVHVEANPFKISLGIPIPSSTGLAYGGQIWVRNNLSASNGFLRYIAMHELFHCSDAVVETMDFSPRLVVYCGA